MKLLKLLVEKIKSFFNGTKVVAEVKVIQPKPAAPKKQEKAVEVTSPVVIGEEAFKQAQLASLEKKQAPAPAVEESPVVLSAPVVETVVVLSAPVVETVVNYQEVEPVVGHEPPVVEEAPKKSKRKYYHKRKPKAK